MEKIIKNGILPLRNIFSISAGSYVDVGVHNHYIPNLIKWYIITDVKTNYFKLVTIVLGTDTLAFLQCRYQ